jgi:hypothetical protein
MKLPENHCVYDCELCSFWIDENGYLCIVAKNAVRTLEKNKATLALIREVTGGRPLCTFIDMRIDSLLLFDLKTKENIACQLSVLFKAVAILAPATLQKVGPTIFLNTVKVPIPIRIFDEEDEAKAWLGLHC